MLFSNRQGFVALPVLIFIAALAIAAGGYFAVVVKNAPSGGVACTMEAMQCPDGSYVGRTGLRLDGVATATQAGSNCEFICPIVSGTEAHNLCGPEPPITCGVDTILGCKRANKRWSCYPLATTSSPATTDIDVSGWQTYRNEKYGFEVKHPATFSMREHYPSNTFMQLIVSQSGKESFIVGIKKSYLPDDVRYYLDTSPNGQLKLGENLWSTYFLPQGYADAGELQSKPIFALQLEHDRLLYSVTFGNQTAIKEEQGQILSTFRFLDVQTNKTFCNVDSDCILWICSGVALNKEYAKTLPPDLPCATYADYKASCINQTCSKVRQ